MSGRDKTWITGDGHEVVEVTENPAGRIVGRQIAEHLWGNRPVVVVSWLRFTTTSPKLVGAHSTGSLVASITDLKAAL